MEIGAAPVSVQGQGLIESFFREGTGDDATYAQYIPITDDVFDSCVQGLVEQAEQPKFGGGRRQHLLCAVMP